VSALDWASLAFVLFAVAFTLWAILSSDDEQMDLPITCPRCQGGPQGDLECYVCGGTGTVTKYTKRRGY
jgi:hypothetical protein